MRRLRRRRDERTSTVNQHFVGGGVRASVRPRVRESARPATAETGNALLCPGGGGEPRTAPRGTSGAACAGTKSCRTAGVKDKNWTDRTPTDRARLGLGTTTYEPGVTGAASKDFRQMRIERTLGGRGGGGGRSTTFGPERH